MFQFFPSTFFNFEYLRVLGAAPFQMSEVSECLEAREYIKNDDAESWYNTWNAFGDKAKSIGEECLRNKDTAGARWAFLRATNYYRSSEFMLHGGNHNDPRLTTAIEKSAEIFDRACELLDTEVINFSIPFEKGLFFPARLFMPDPKTRPLGKIPLILQNNGFDSTSEELYLYGASGAIPRGYAVLTFDGPGQGLSLRKDKTLIRPDWENVTSKVLDFIENHIATKYDRLELDLNRIATMGSSMGGYFALRAGADPRIKAAISCDGFYSLFDVTKSRMPGFFLNSWLNGTIGDGIFNGVLNFLAKFNFQLKWELMHGQWCYGVKTHADMLRYMQKMSLKDPETGEEYLKKVNCAVMVTGAAQTIYFEPEMHAEVVMKNLDHLPDEKKVLVIGDGTSNGGIQAKVATLDLMHRTHYSWLDKVLNVRRLPQKQAE